MGVTASLQEALTPAVVAAIARSVGVPDGVAAKALAAAAPGLLATLAQAASSGAGAQAFATALARQAATAEVDPLAAFTQRGPDTAEAGSAVLADILGGGQLGVFKAQVRAHTGLPEGSAGLMVGLLGSLVMGVIGRASRTAGISAGDAASWLARQRQEIAPGVPGGFADALQAAGLDIGRPAPAAAPRVAAAAAPPPPPPLPAMEAPKPRRISAWPWIGIAAVVLIGWLLWSFASRSHPV